MLRSCHFFRSPRLFLFLFVCFLGSLWRRVFDWLPKDECTSRSRKFFLISRLFECAYPHRRNNIKRESVAARCYPEISDIYNIINMRWWRKYRFYFFMASPWWLFWISRRRRSLFPQWRLIEWADKQAPTETVKAAPVYNISTTFSFLFYSFTSSWSSTFVWFPYHLPRFHSPSISSPLQRATTKKTSLFICLQSCRYVWLSDRVTYYATRLL